MRCRVVLQNGCFYSNGNQYPFMQASFFIIVRNGFSNGMNFSICGSSAWWSRAAHGALECSGYPGQSAQFDSLVGGQHDVSENTPNLAGNNYSHDLYDTKVQCKWIKKAWSCEDSQLNYFQRFVFLPWLVLWQSLSCLHQRVPPPCHTGAASWP